MNNESVSAPPCAGERRRWQKFALLAVLAVGSVVVASQFSSTAPVTAAQFGKGKGKKKSTPSFWLPDYARARAEARTSGKPIFVVIRCEP